MIIESLQRDFGASRGSVSLVFALAGFLYFSVGSISGPLADRFGSRRLALIGVILIGTGPAIASVAQNLLRGLCGLRSRRRMLLCSRGRHGAALVRATAWFHLGDCFERYSFGTLIVPPLASLLITHVGWRETYLILGLVAVIAGVAIIPNQKPQRSAKRELGDKDAGTSRLAQGARRVGYSEPCRA